MKKDLFQQRLNSLQRAHRKLLAQGNRKQKDGNGIFDRYEFPVLTADHVPLDWQYDFNRAHESALDDASGH